MRNGSSNPSRSPGESPYPHPAAGHGTGRRPRPLQCAVRTVGTLPAVLRDLDRHPGAHRLGVRVATAAAVSPPAARSSSPATSPRCCRRNVTDGTGTGGESRPRRRGARRQRGCVRHDGYHTALAGRGGELRRPDPRLAAQRVRQREVQADDAGDSGRDQPVRDAVRGRSGRGAAARTGVVVLLQHQAAFPAAQCQRGVRGEPGGHLRRGAARHAHRSGRGLAGGR